eukprot:COSAG03_NODE_1935_length_3337_cov_1.810686_2_plen_215_part_00
MLSQYLKVPLLPESLSTAAAQLSRRRERFFAEVPRCAWPWFGTSSSLSKHPLSMVKRRGRTRRRSGSHSCSIASHRSSRPNNSLPPLLSASTLRSRDSTRCAAVAQMHARPLACSNHCATCSACTRFVHSDKIQPSLSSIPGSAPDVSTREQRRTRNHCGPGPPSICSSSRTSPACTRATPPLTTSTGSWRGSGGSYALVATYGSKQMHACMHT